MIKTRLIAGLTAGVLCLGALCACGANPLGGSGVTEDNGPMTMFLSQSDDWLNLLEDSCKTSAENNGYTLEVVNANGDADAQIRQIRDSVRKGEGAFLVNLVDPSRAEEAIQAAGSRDIVFINRAPTDLSVLDDTHIYVGSEESEAGELQGQVLAEYCQSEGMTNINYLLIEGPASQPSSAQRAQAVLDILSTNKNFALTAAHDALIGNYNRETAKSEMEACIAEGISEQDIDVVIATDDAMALGASEAMREAGWSKMPAIIGVDGLPDALESIKDGSMMMTAYQDADRQAETAVTVANNLNHGYDYDRNILAADRVDNHIFWVSFQSVTSDNVNSFLS